MHIVVLRFSALGDAALLVPVLQALKKSQPKLRITVLSRPFLRPLFAPLEVDFYPANLKGQHRGLAGLWRLAQQVRKELRPDLIIDQHAVLRTKLLCSFWRLMGIKNYSLQKDRAGRKALTRYPRKELRPLQHSAENYRQTFERAGFAFPFHRESDHRVAFARQAETEAFWQEQRAPLNIGIAPFARHQAKQWPLEKMRSLLQSYDPEQARFFLFGGPDEKEALEKLLKESKAKATVVAGRFALDQEIALMQGLNAMLAMDSSNMHLAALAGIPVVSVWGGTHPFAGFSALGPNDRYQVQLQPEELDCRPCSAFGAKACFRGDYACLHHLEAERVRRQLQKALE